MSTKCSRAKHEGRKNGAAGGWWDVKLTMFKELKPIRTVSLLVVPQQT